MKKADIAKAALAASAVGIGVMELSRKYRWEKEYLRFGEGLSKVVNEERADGNGVFVADEGKGRLPFFWLDEKKTSFIDYWTFAAVKEDYVRAIKGVSSQEERDKINKKIWHDAIKLRFLRPLTRDEAAWAIERLNEYSDEVDLIKIETAAYLQEAFTSNTFFVDDIFNESYYSNATANLRRRHKNGIEIIDDIVKQLGRYNTNMAQSLKMRQNDLNKIVEGVNGQIVSMRRSHLKAFNDKKQALKKQADLFYSQNVSRMNKELAEAEGAVQTLKDGFQSVREGYRAIEGWQMTEWERAGQYDYFYTKPFAGGFINASEAMEHGSSVKTAEHTFLRARNDKYEVREGQNGEIYRRLKDQKDFRYTTFDGVQYGRHKDLNFSTTEMEKSFNEYDELAAFGIKPQSVKKRHKSAGLFSSAKTDYDYYDIPKSKWQNMLEKDETDLWGNVIAELSVSKPVLHSYNWAGVVTEFVVDTPQRTTLMQASAARMLIDGERDIIDTLPDMMEARDEIKHNIDTFKREFTPEFLQKNFNSGMEFMADPTKILDGIAAGAKNMVLDYAKTEAMKYLQGMGLNAAKDMALDIAKQYGKDFMAMGLDKMNDIVGGNIGDHINVPYVKEAFRLITEGADFFSAVLDDFRNIAAGFNGDYNRCFQGIDGLYDKFLGAGTALGVIVRAIPVVGQVLMAYDVMRTIPGFEHVGGAVVGALFETGKAYVGAVRNFASSITAGNIGGAIVSYFKAPYEIMVAGIKSLAMLAEGSWKMAKELGKYVAKTLNDLVNKGGIGKFLKGDFAGGIRDFGNGLQNLIDNLGKKIGGVLWGSSSTTYFAKNTYLDQEQRNMLAAMGET